MKTIILKLIEKFSTRNTIALWFGVLATYVHYKHMSDDNAVEMLMIDVLGAFLSVKFINFKDIMILKNGYMKSDKNESSAP